MKDDKDTFTVDLADAPAVRRQRGRPADPNAPTAAQRQAKYRARLRDAGKAELSVVVSQDVIDALVKFVEFKDMSLGQVVDKVLRDRLLRKR